MRATILYVSKPSVRAGRRARGALNMNIVFASSQIAIKEIETIYGKEHNNIIIYNNNNNNNMLNTTATAAAAAAVASCWLPRARKI